MISAKAMSDKIRMKRKSMMDDGVDNMVDTAALPQMNPQDVYNLKHKAQIEETLDSPEQGSAPSDPADGNIEGTSQDMSELKRQMAKVAKIFEKLSVG